MIRISNSRYAFKQMCVRDLAARCARALRRLPPSQEEGAGKAGCALHPRSRVQNARVKTHTSIQVQRRHPAFPAQWFLPAYTALTPVTGLSCHRHPREVLLPANLTPASGCQVHTSSPSARVALVSRKLRVHRIPPHVRNDREPPLSSGETGRISKGDLPDVLSEIFLREGLDFYF